MDKFSGSVLKTEGTQTEVMHQYQISFVFFPLNRKKKTRLPGFWRKGNIGLPKLSMDSSLHKGNFFSCHN